MSVVAAVVASGRSELKGARGVQGGVEDETIETIN